jgi:hypothetical protein
LGRYRIKVAHWDARQFSRNISGLICAERIKWDNNMTRIQNNMRQVFKIIAGILLVVAVVLAHLFMPSQASALAGETIRSLHGPGFGIVALIILKLVRQEGRPTASYAKAAALTMSLAVLAEVAQIPGGRGAQVSDLVNDALGIIGFLGIAASLDTEVRREFGTLRQLFVALVGASAMITTLWPTFSLGHAMARRAMSLPQIATFDNAWERAYVSGEGADLELIDAPVGWPQQSGNVAHLKSAGKYGLMLHVFPYPDWRGFSGVSLLAATTDGEPRRVAFGLWGIEPDDGSQASRYYGTRVITADPTRYCINFDDLQNAKGGKAFDLSRVHQLMLGATRPVSGERLLVDDIRLERSSQNCPARIADRRN